MNTALIPLLSRELTGLSDAHFRLLKLLSTKYSWHVVFQVHKTRFFRPELYQNHIKIAAGAYGTVYKCTLMLETGISVNLDLFTLLLGGI